MQKCKWFWLLWHLLRAQRVKLESDVMCDSHDVVLIRSNLSSHQSMQIMSKDVHGAHTEKKGKFMLCITLRQQVAFFVFLLIIIMSCVCLCMCANVNMGSHAKNSYIIPYKIWWVVALFSFHTECGNSLALCASRMNRLCISEVYNMNGQRMGPCLWRKWLLPFHFYCAVGLVRVLHIFSIM